jgi:hypothetical protein
MGVFHERRLGEQGGEEQRRRIDLPHIFEEVGEGKPMEMRRGTPSSLLDLPR